jgi:hypothetical protein
MVTFWHFSISEIMSSFQALLPLVGVVVGWMLKSVTDFLTTSHRERVTRRKCTFYLLRAWKALLDYERFVSLATSSRPDVEEYEPQRQIFAARFLSRIAEDKDSLVTGVDMLASIDPTAAAQLDNTIKNIRRALQFEFSDLIKNDPAAYVEAMNSHNDLIDWTLSDFEKMAEKLAKRSGFCQKRKVSDWFEARRKGSQEFKDEFAAFQQRVQERKAKAFKNPNMTNTQKAFLQIFTDPSQWDEAKWSATGFIYDPQGRRNVIPGLGIGFADFEVGKRIFEGWIKRVGHVDQFEEIRVSIVEGPIPDKPDGYTVLISSNPENTIRRKQQTDPDFKPTNIMLVSRIHRMNPSPGSPNLRMFKQAFNDFGYYRLFPAHVADNEVKEMDVSLYVERARNSLSSAPGNSGAFSFARISSRGCFRQSV